jgi:hypothetical protein
MNLSPPVPLSKISLEASSPTSPTPKSPKSPLLPHALAALRVKDAVDLDTPDELALRSLLLGIHYRTLEAFDVARGFLVQAHGYHSELKVNTWIGGLAMFELAVLDLKEAEDRHKKRVTVVVRGIEKEDGPMVNGDKSYFQAMGDDEEMSRVWSEVLKAARVKLDVALDLSTNSVDLSSRLDSRIAILKDEISTKLEILGIVA